MRIAIASQNWLTITAHPGKTGRFRVFEGGPGCEPVELDRIELPPEMTIHNWQGGGDHPLFAMDLVITGTAGPGFINRLAANGVRVVTTSERDPKAALTQLFDGTLPPAVPHGH